MGGFTVDKSTIIDFETVVIRGNCSSNVGWIVGMKMFLLVHLADNKIKNTVTVFKSVILFGA
jgi:hypothetical protein